jgi:hypothetical protein
MTPTVPSIPGPFTARRPGFREILRNLIPYRFKPKVKARDMNIEDNGIPMKEIVHKGKDIDTTRTSQTFPTFPSFLEPSTDQRPRDENMLRKLIHRSLYPQESEDERLGRYYRLEDEVNRRQRQMSLYEVERPEEVFVAPTVSSISGLSRPRFRDRLRNIRQGRRSSQMPFTGQNSASKPTLERDFLGKIYLQKLSEIGYEFGDKIGDGKYGTVFECFFFEELQNPSTRRPLVCKKVVIPENILNEKLDFAKNRLNPERLALTLARHPNIITIQNIWSNYESFEVVFPVFVLLFMEKADGNLSRFLKDRAKVQRIPIEEPEIKLWFKMILEGLKYLHSISIAHLELRPQSILYVWDRHQKYPFLAKITDFGMSYFAGNNRSMNLRNGTQGFIAPEVEESAYNGVYNPFRADIYSFGKLLDYMKSFLVHGKQKPESEHLFITEELDNLVYWMTDSFPDLRPTFEQIEEQAWLQSK